MASRRRHSSQRFRVGNVSAYLHHGAWWLYTGTPASRFDARLPTTAMMPRSWRPRSILIEEVDLQAGWLCVCNKTELGWRVKTGAERAVPLIPEAVAVLKAVIGSRRAGPVIIRERLADRLPSLVGDRAELEGVCQERQRAVERPCTRSDLLRVARRVWWDAGIVKADAV